MNTKEDFIRRFDDITTAVKEIPYMCGYCYTQLTDVYQEKNGIYAFDRREKFDADALAKARQKALLRWLIQDL